MADEEQLQQLRRGVQEWNAWKDEYPEEEMDLSGADLKGVDLSEANLSGANLKGADLSNVELWGADLSGAKLSGAILYGADLSDANLRDADLKGASLPMVDLYGADLRRANLSSAHLNEAHLSGANLKGADLSDANLSDANLSEVDLSRAIFSGADLGKAHRSRFHRSKVHLSGADLSDAKLDGAYLNGTRLNGTRLNRARLGEAEISNTIFNNTFFALNDFRLVKGLVTARHEGPSHIDLYSVQLPQDGSALHFLRGVGVPDEWIDIYRAQMMHPIQYYSVFISYSSKDEQLARRLHADLQAQGVRCWFAPHDMRPGTYMRKEIDQAIHLQDKMLLLLSEDAIASGWVEHEVEIALAREREQHRDILFPIRLDATVLQIRTGWAASLRKLRHIGDFTTWENAQAYQMAFERLLRDLKDTQS